MTEIRNEAELRKNILQSELERLTAQYQFPVQLRSNIALHLKATQIALEDPLCCPLPMMKRQCRPNHFRA